MRLHRRPLPVRADQRGRDEPRLLRDAELHLLHALPRARHGDHRHGYELLHARLGQQAQDLRAGLPGLPVDAVQGHMQISFCAANGRFGRLVLRPRGALQGEEPARLLALPDGLLHGRRALAPRRLQEQDQPRHLLLRRPPPQHRHVEHLFDLAEHELARRRRGRLQLRQRRPGIRGGRGPCRLLRGYVCCVGRQGVVLLATHDDVYKLDVRGGADVDVIRTPSALGWSACSLSPNSAAPAFVSCAPSWLPHRARSPAWFLGDGARPGSCARLAGDALSTG
mmetsp:Transcript_41576/g.125593  ORF Transcript_41576/g.125593 Transcript_41576/m.125593 type:complete len:281 (+) Transcript_41576:417-1259(+)